MSGTFISLEPQHRIGPLEIVPRQVLSSLTPLSKVEDSFNVLTSDGPFPGGPNLGSVQGILNGKREMSVLRASDDELWFTWRVTALEGNGTLNFVSVPFPGPYRGDLQMYGGSFRDEVGSDEPGVFTFDGQRVSFNLHAPGENMPGLKAGQTSRTYFIRTTATWWVPGGRIRYTAQRGGSSSATMPGSALALVPFIPNDRFTEYADGPAHLFGGIAQGGGGLVFIPGSGFKPVPPPRPDAIAHRLAELANLHQAATSWASPTLAETIHREVQQEVAALSRLRPDKEAEAS
jgi:hypothetical protein